MLLVEAGPRYCGVLSSMPTTGDSALRDKFHNILLEMRRDEAHLMREDYSTANVKEITRLRALSLKAVRDLCEAVSLPCSFLEGSSVQDARLEESLPAIVAARDAYFASIHEQVRDRCKRKRQGSEEQGKLARAKNAINLVLRRWSGMELARNGGARSRCFVLRQSQTTSEGMISSVVEVLT